MVFIQDYTGNVTVYCTKVVLENTCSVLACVYNLQYY